MSKKITGPAEACVSLALYQLQPEKWEASPFTAESSRKVDSETPIFLQTSSTRVPVSAWFRAKAICSSVQRVIFILDDVIFSGKERPETPLYAGTEQKEEISELSNVDTAAKN